MCGEGTAGACCVTCSSYEGGCTESAADTEGCEPGRVLGTVCTVAPADSGLSLSEKHVLLE